MSQSETSTQILEKTLPSDFIPHRIFINHVDSFVAKHFTSFITDQIYGATRIENSPEEAINEEQEEQTTQNINLEADSKNYEIIGTLRYPFNKKTEDILYTIRDDDENYLEEILRCGFIVYDITQDNEEIVKVERILKAIKKHLKKIEEIGPKTYEKYTDRRVFILLSTVMTWAKTKSTDSSVPFSEIDYRRRRPHPNYKKHLDCEKQVIQAGRKFSDKFKTYVLCSGIIYGHEEQDFDFLFKLAWNNERYLPIFNGGNNFVPLIHVDDLSRIFHRLMENPPNKPQYIVAVEETPTTLRKICNQLSRELGSGMCKNVPVEEAFFYPTIKQTNLERCTLNIKMEPVFIIENLQLEWRNESNLSNNMRNIVQEFKNAWNLQPLKIIIHGPPASGKTTLSKMICERYNLHYVSLDTVIKETLEELRAKLAYVQQNVKEVDIELGEEEGEEEEDDDYVVDVEAIEEQIKELTSADNGQLLEKYIKSFLEKNLCQNQGYVLDDYPRTFSQANQLFGANSDGMEEEEAVGEATSILPTHVLSLEAPDEWLCERVMRLPEVNVQGTPYHEDKMMERLSKFRSDNTEDDTVLNFFDNMEIHPILIDVRQNFHCIFSCICEQLGEPVGFGLTVEEEMELLELEKAELKLNEERKEMEKQRLEEEITLKRHEKMEKWSETLQALQREEEKILIAQSEPLRTYLIKYIFPVLTNGLLEIVKIRPEDPVDYLAEYLFRENPEGRMFDPSYTMDGEKLLKDVEKTLKN